MVPDSEAADYAVAAAFTDPSALQQYLRKYPNGKNTTQVLSKLEEIEWENVNRTDLTSLGEFLQTHPQGQHANEARRLVEELQNELADFIAVVKAGSSEGLQGFLNRHPNSPYAEQVRQKYPSNWIGRQFSVCFAVTRNPTIEGISKVLSTFGLPARNA